MAFHVYVYLLVVFLILCLALLWLLCWFPLRPSSNGKAKPSTLHRQLRPLSPDDCPACHLASPPSSGGEPAPVRPWREVKSRRGARHPHRHAGLCLSMPAVPVLREHRCALSCAGWRWQTWQGRTHPDVSLSGLPHHVQCSTHTPLYRLKTPLNRSLWCGLRAGRGAGPFRCRAGLRLSTSHHHAPF